MSREARVTNVTEVTGEVGGISEENMPPATVDNAEGATTQPRSTAIGNNKATTDRRAYYKSGGAPLNEEAGGGVHQRSETEVHQDSGDPFQQGFSDEYGRVIAAIWSDDEVFLSKRERELAVEINQAVYKRRMVIIVLTLIQPFLLIAAFAYSVAKGDGTTNWIDAFRSIYLFVALLLTLSCCLSLGNRKQVHESLRTVFVYRVSAFACELSCFALGSHYTTMFTLGIFIVGLTLVTLGILLTMMYATRLIAYRGTGFSFSQYMAKGYYDEGDRMTAHRLAANIGQQQMAQNEASSSGNATAQGPTATSSATTTTNTQSQQQQANMFSRAYKNVSEAVFSTLSGNHRMGNASASTDDEQSPKKKKTNQTDENTSGGATNSASENQRPPQQSKDNSQEEKFDWSPICFGEQSHWKNWVIVHKIRQALYQKHHRGWRLVILVLALLTLVSLVHIVYQFMKIFSNQPPLFSEDLNKKYNEETLVKWYMPGRTHSSWKVHVVVMDGLREDLTDAGTSAIGNYFENNATFKASSMKFEAKVQLPSFSVPNWASILIGAPPETHGVTGNLANVETTFDHIFREAKKYGLHAGMTGTPWWKDLVFSTLPELDGDGTIWSDFVPENYPSYPWETSDPADWSRLAVALKAVKRSTVPNPFGTENLYDLFLTHFSDIDKQGHEYGIDTKWNEYNSYMGAIANKTIALQQIVDAIDDKTVLIITSDHGHVMRGGHGGVSDELLDVPVVFYVKNRNMTGFSSATEFLPNLSPRDHFDGHYSNLDLSSTICALLGIPAPRQSIGVFFEEAITELVPAAVRNHHYYDLYMAKRSMALEYAEMMGTLYWGDHAKTPLLTNATLFGSNGTESTATYAAAVRNLVEEIEHMRDQLAWFSVIRNLFASLLVILFLMFIVFRLFYSDTGLFFHGHKENVKRFSEEFCRENNRANMAALLSVVFHVSLSLAAFSIEYFGIIGYSVWDRSLVHTPSVAGHFIAGVIIAPAIAFLLITKIYLAPAIDWNCLKIGREQDRMKAAEKEEEEEEEEEEEMKKKKDGSTGENRTEESPAPQFSGGVTVATANDQQRAQPQEADKQEKEKQEKEKKENSSLLRKIQYVIMRVLTWLTYIIRDLGIFFFATDRYKEEEFPHVYTYVYFLAFWSALVNLFLLFLCFPFTYFLPIVMSVTYVTSFDQRHMFRMLCMLMMEVWLLIGTLILLCNFPRWNGKTLPLWNVTLVKTFVEKSRTELSMRREEVENSPELKSLDDPNLHRLDQRLHLIVNAKLALEEPKYLSLADDLCEAPFFNS